MVGDFAFLPCDLISILLHQQSMYQTEHASVSYHQDAFVELISVDKIAMLCELWFMGTTYLRSQIGCLSSFPCQGYTVLDVFQ